MINLQIFDSLSKVLPADMPTTPLVRGTAFQNERFNALVYATVDVDGIYTFTVEGVEETPYLIRRVKEEKALNCNPEGSDDYVLSHEAGLYYDILEPTEEKISLLAGEKNLFMLSLCGDKGAFSSGERTVTIRLCGEKEAGKESFLLSVVPCDLVSNDVFVTHWIHYDCIANTHDVEPFSKAFYTYFSSYLKSYVEHGNNMLLTPIFTPPLDTAFQTYRRTTQLVDVYFDGGKYTFGFDRLNEFLDFVFARGIQYIEFSHLFTQWGAEFCPKIAVWENGILENRFGWDKKSDGEEYTAFLSAFLPALMRFIKEKGIQDKCYFHLSDEPPEEGLERYKNLSNLMHSLIECPIMDAFGTFEFAKQGLIDTPVVSISRTQKFIEERFPHAVYNCCFPRVDCYTNRFLYLPALRMRILGVMMYVNEAKGYLHWGYNFYNEQYSLGTIDPYETPDANGKWPAGDTFIVYPTKEGCIDSIRHETFLESMQDLRALKTLERLCGREYVLGLIGGEVSGYNRYPHQEEWLLNLRERIAEEIKNRVL